MRKLLTTLFLVVLATVAWAQNAVAVWQQDGKVAKFGFAEKPVVTYADNNLVITTTQTTVEYPIYLLRKISFDVDWTVDAVEEVKADVQFSFRGGSLTVRGGEAGSQVYIYNLKGVKVGQYRLDSDGNATIPTESLGKDFYVVKSKSFTFKFRKS